MMEDDPLGYARALAEQIPDMAGFCDQRDDHLARLLVSLYGDHLERSERALWAIWSRTPETERSRARTAG